MTDIIIHDITIDEFADYDHDGIGYLIGTGRVDEVVRCKNCRWNLLPPSSGNADCQIYYGMTNPNGFCSYGERREDEQLER